MYGLGMGEVEKEKNTGEGERKKRKREVITPHPDQFPLPHSFSLLPRACGWPGYEAQSSYPLLISLSLFLSPPRDPLPIITRLDSLHSSRERSPPSSPISSPPPFPSPLLLPSHLLPSSSSPPPLPSSHHCFLSSKQLQQMFRL